MESAGPQLGPRAVVLTGGLIVAAFGILLLSTYILPQLKFLEDVRSGDIPMSYISGGRLVFVPDAETLTYFALRLVLSILNLALVVYLLYSYTKDYLRLRTSFSLGIVAFLFSFLLYALSSLPLMHTLFGGPRGYAGVFSFVPLLFSALGLALFAKLSNE